MKYLKYLNYLLRHKWYVMVECFKVGLIWRGLVHDLSKFLPSEFFPYAEYFYGKKKETEYFDNNGIEGEYSAPYGTYVEEAFNIAWLKHIHRNKHHWQYWVLREDSGNTFAIPMPEVYRKEMLCDWRGAGKAIHGKDETKEWYLANRDKMMLRTETREWVEHKLAIDEGIKEITNNS